jgi:hypothetical protein
MYIGPKVVLFFFKKAITSLTGTDFVEALVVGAPAPIRPLR